MRTRRYAAALLGGSGAVLTLVAWHLPAGHAGPYRLAAGVQVDDVLIGYLQLEAGALLLLGGALLMLSRWAATLGSLVLFVAGCGLTRSGIRMYRMADILHLAGGIAAASGIVAIALALVMVHARLATRRPQPSA